MIEYVPYILMYDVAKDSDDESSSAFKMKEGDSHT